jgi:hypothetical protein
MQTSPSISHPSPVPKPTNHLPFLELEYVGLLLRRCWKKFLSPCLHSIHHYQLGVHSHERAPAPQLGWLVFPQSVVGSTDLPRCE